MATVEIGMTNGSLKLLHKENILFIDSQKMENPKNVQKKIEFNKSRNETEKVNFRP